MSKPTVQNQPVQVPQLLQVPQVIIAMLLEPINVSLSDKMKQNSNCFYDCVLLVSKPHFWSGMFLDLLFAFYSEKLEMGFRSRCTHILVLVLWAIWIEWAFKVWLACSRLSPLKNQSSLFISSKLSKDLNSRRHLHHVQHSAPKSVTQTALSAVAMLLLHRSTSLIHLLLHRTAHRSATACVSVPVLQNVVQIHSEELTVTPCHILLAYLARLTAIIAAVVTALYNAAGHRWKDTCRWHILWWRP